MLGFSFDLLKRVPLFWRPLRDGARGKDNKDEYKETKTSCCVFPPNEGKPKTGEESDLNLSQESEERS
ncbi:MAG: hypothetical protein D6679_02225 [Candidatus Hydrogenedentota bacterium]|nr:MAG: hypothetical protein D6679_02225 [Candidatus Hydrogenedentota bacterium]